MSKHSLPGSIIPKFQDTLGLGVSRLTLPVVEFYERDGLRQHLESHWDEEIDVVVRAVAKLRKAS